MVLGIPWRSPIQVLTELDVTQLNSDQITSLRQHWSPRSTSSVSYGEVVLRTCHMMFMRSSPCLTVCLYLFSCPFVQSQTGLADRPQRTFPSKTAPALVRLGEAPISRQLAKQPPEKSPTCDVLDMEFFGAFCGLYAISCYCFICEVEAYTPCYKLGSFFT